MSFYGTTYYQLIDTFYKILVNNAGKTGVTFPSPADISTNNVELAAKGRKGILTTGTGNRWIQLTTDSDNDSYTIWHGWPDSSAANTTVVAATSPATANNPIALEPGDYITIPALRYDKAGHIANSNNSVTFQLPITKTDEDFSNIQTAIEDLQKQDTALLQKDSEIQGTLDTHDSEIANLQSTDTNFSKTIGEFEKIVYPNANDNIPARSVSNTIGVFEKTIDAFQDDNLTIASALSKLKSDFDGLTGTVNMQSIVINDLQKRIEALENA